MQTSDSLISLSRKRKKKNSRLFFGKNFFRNVWFSFRFWKRIARPWKHMALFPHLLLNPFSRSRVEGEVVLPSMKGKQTPFFSCLYTSFRAALRHRVTSFTKEKKLFPEIRERRRLSSREGKHSFSKNCKPCKKANNRRDFPNHLDTR